MVSLENIHSVAEQIGHAFRPHKIILFGSYAYGAPTEESDIDMLVVMAFEGKSAKKAAEIFQELKTALPLDLIVRTQEQLKERLEMNDFFLRNIVEKGRVLYEAAHA